MLAQLVTNLSKLVSCLPSKPNEQLSILLVAATEAL